MTDRQVFVNADVITMDAADRRARALAWENGRLVRVGSDDEVKDLIEAGWPHRDLGGRAVLPGFIDTHQHLMHTGLAATAAQLQDAVDLDDLLDRLRDHAARTDPGDWVRGSNLNEQTLAEKRMPTKEDLDRVTTDRPVCVLHATVHMASFNTRGLELVQPPLDLDGLDLENNRPTGVVRDPGILTHVHPALSRLMPDHVRSGALDAAARMALSQGITTVHALDGGDLGPGDTRRILDHQDRLPVRVVCYNQSMDLSEVRDLGLPRVGGCICSDGAFEAHTAAMFEPYADQPDNYGALTYTQEVMDRFIMDAHRQGLQIAVHCEADRSIEQVLWAMEKAIRAHPRDDHRHRIEHLELPTFNQLDRMAAAGIMTGMQPAFIPAFIGSRSMEISEIFLGRARLSRVHPYRAILDRGIPIAGGSDSPVTPYHPLAGVQAAVRHPNPDQRVSVTEALAMFTSAAAYAAFEEKDKGSLEPGKLADMVILDRSPHDVEYAAGIAIEAVYVGGERV
jgi:hypothetical protein